MKKMKHKKKYNVALMGATGAVGQEMIRILEERKFPIQSIRFLASKRSAGKSLRFRGKEYKVQVLDEKSFGDIDIVLASAGGSVSRKFAPIAVRQGAVVIDNTSAFRMDKGVPLVIPEINPEEIKKHRGIIANPNCSTIVMLVPLYPLDRVNRIRRIQVATYQAVSGAGTEGMEELRIQAGQVLGHKPLRKKIFPHQVAFNLFSHDSRIGPKGYNEEEMKMVNETRKIFKRAKIQLAVTCVRVPVFRSHSEAIYVDFSKPMTPDRARRLLKKAPGVKIVDQVATNTFPMPVDSAHQDDIFVGRIRQDLHSKKTLGLFVSGDQIRKGAALNAVQIAEHLIKG